MTRKVYEVTSHISAGISGKPREFSAGDRVTWRSFHEYEQEGRRAMTQLIASNTVRERDLDAES